MKMKNTELSIQMKVSIIMTVYNEELNLVINSIKSVLDQTYNDIEIIIVSDNPHNKVLNNYVKQLSEKYDNIKTIFNNSNLGQSKSRNIGIRNSNGDFIAILDSDDISEKNRIENELDFLIKNNLDFVFSNYSISYVNKLGHKKVVRSVAFSKKDIINQESLRNILINDYNVTLHSSWLVKKSVYTNLSGYRDLIPVEDFDFLLRAIAYNYKIGYISEVLVEKIEREDGVSKNNLFFQYEDAKILQRYYKKNSFDSIIDVKDFFEIHNTNITKRKLKKFMTFNKELQSFKEKKSVGTFFKLLILLFSSNKIIAYAYDKIRLKLKGY